MTQRKFRTGLLALAIAAAFTPSPSQAIAPALLFMVKQMVQQAATSMIKDALLSGLNGMGCKGIALSNALSALDLRRGGLPMGMPTLPAGMALPTMPSMAGMPGMPGMPIVPGMPPGAAGMAGMLPGGAMPGGGAIPPEMLARMGAMMQGGMPPGMAIDPAQMAMMARMQQMLGEPLSPAETVATIDELFELGFMPKAIQSEFKECMVLVPASVQALGMGMGMMKPMIPQLRQAREEIRALSPAEQDELAEALVEQIRPLPADQRAALMEHLDSGFFPKRIGDGVKARLGTR